MKKVAILGAGPAGLTAAYQLSKRHKFEIYLIEKDSLVGGLSKTIEFDGNRFDLGGHRYFSTDEHIKEIWKEVLPIEKEKMLVRDRSSHILFEGNMYPYPLVFSWEVLRKLGFRRAIGILGSYMRAVFSKSNVNTLEDYYIKKFGRKLYELFFESYTYKLWGRPALAMPDTWGYQRTQNVTLGKIVSDLFIHNRSSKTLERQFLYPTYGSGQLWDSMMNRCVENGVNVMLQSEIISIQGLEDKTRTVVIKTDLGTVTIDADIIISSIPLKELIVNNVNAPTLVKKSASVLEYRDMIVMGLTFDKSVAGPVLKRNDKDCWIYLQENSIKTGRLQILNNWSPKMVNAQKDYLIEVEYFCNKSDSIWNLNDDQVENIIERELVECGIISTTLDEKKYSVQRVEKAYPIYDFYDDDMKIIKKWIKSVPDLYCIGRNGRHVYDNMDQAMQSAIDIVEAIVTSV